VADLVGSSLHFVSHTAESLGPHPFLCISRAIRLRTCRAPWFVGGSADSARIKTAGSLASFPPCSGRQRLGIAVANWVACN
jgi:hypothetical protein